MKGKKAPRENSRGAFCNHKGGICVSVFGRPGGDRLSHVLARSTIGAGGFNGRVRNGIGWNSPAMTTRPAKDGSGNQKSELRNLKNISGQTTQNLRILSSEFRFLRVIARLGSLPGMGQMHERSSLS